MDFIRIENLSRRFGKTVAVDTVSLSIGRGEFFSLLGPSGCGKTTLLRIIGGFDYPDSGTVRIDGEAVTDLPPNKRPTNMVFQSYAIFPHLNVFDNIAYGLRRERLPRAELVQRVNSALALVKLEDYGGRTSGQLSGGQRQRVALARALVRRPKVLLLDEPLGALDRRLREAMQVELRQLQKNLGITFLFVTHDQQEALAMSDRVAVMSGGRILQVAPPRALYETPNCREVADFIGEMNFFAGRVADVFPGEVLVEAQSLGRIRLPAPFALSAGDDVLLALRPEKIALSRQPQGGHCLAGTLLASAFLGERTHVTVRLEGREQPVSVSLQNRGDLDLPADGAVHLSFAPEAVTLLRDQSSPVIPGRTSRSDVRGRGPM